MLAPPSETAGKKSRFMASGGGSSTSRASSGQETIRLAAGAAGAGSRQPYFHLRNYIPTQELYNEQEEPTNKFKKQLFFLQQLRMYLPTQPSLQLNKGAARRFNQCFLMIMIMILIIIMFTSPVFE